jgi:hypothetical protein
MTRQTKKDRERFYAKQWLLRRRISACLEDHEHPDFVVRHEGETLGIEIVEYHGEASGRRGRKGRQVEAAWETLQDYSDKFRERYPDIDSVDVRLHFKDYKMPPPRSFEPFCKAIAELIRNNQGLGENIKRTIKNQALHPLLDEYLLGVELFGAKCWSHWEWPAYMNGGVGTSEGELYAVVAAKLANYGAPAGIDSSHLVIGGGGPARTRIAAPTSALHLSNYAKLNKALDDGPFATVAILCLRDFIWCRNQGWKDFRPFE